MIHAQDAVRQRKAPREPAHLRTRQQKGRCRVGHGCTSDTSRLTKPRPAASKSMGPGPSFAPQVRDWSSENLGGREWKKPGLPFYWPKASLSHGRHRSTPGGSCCEHSAISSRPGASARPIPTYWRLAATVMPMAAVRSTITARSCRRIRHRRSAGLAARSPARCARFVASAGASAARLSGLAVEGVFAFLAPTFPCSTQRRCDEHACTFRDHLCPCCCWSARSPRPTRHCVRQAWAPREVLPAAG